MIVPRRVASSMSNRSFPGFQPCSRARFQSFVNFFDWPMMTLKPLSFIFNDCPGPCTPYPRTAMVSFFRMLRAFAMENSFLMITSSFTPPKSIMAIRIFLLSWYVDQIEVNYSPFSEHLEGSKSLDLPASSFCLYHSTNLRIPSSIFTVGAYPSFSLAFSHAEKNRHRKGASFLQD